MPSIKDIPGLITGSKLRGLRNSAREFVSANSEHHRKSTEYLKDLAKNYKEGGPAYKALASGEAEDVMAYRNKLRDFTEQIDQTRRHTNRARVVAGAALLTAGVGALALKRKNEVKKMSKTSSLMNEIVENSFADELTKIADSYDMNQGRESTLGKLLGFGIGAVAGGFGGRALGRMASQGVGRVVGQGVQQGMQRVGDTAAESMMAASRAALKAQRYTPHAVAGLGALTGGMIGKSIGA